MIELVRSFDLSEMLMVVILKNSLWNSIVIASRGGGGIRRSFYTHRLFLKCETDKQDGRNDGLIEDCEKRSDWRIDLVSETRARD